MEKIYKYPQSMVQQGITTKQELQQRLQDIFEQVEHQESALIEIYKLFFPNWEDIKQVGGFPDIGREMWKFICAQFIEFDSQHHPNVFKGGLWISHGFFSSEELAPWGVSMENCNIIYA